MAVADLKTDRSDKAKLVERVLSDPDLFPDEFKAWIPRWLGGNVNFSVVQAQLPAVETPRLVGDTGNAQFQGTWVNFGGTDARASYWKDPWGVVHLRGTVKLGAAIPGVIFTLPAGYRPQYNEIFPAASNNAYGQVSVSTAGDVTASVGSTAWITLNGISFRAYS